jgi:hypothetical protein
MFDDMTDDELAQASRTAAEAGLAAARLVAATRLTDGPGKGIGRPPAVVKMMMARDQTDARWERLGPYEHQWALLVIRIVAPVMDPVSAVADARRRGSSWATIGTALGVAAQSAHTRFAGRI